MIETEHNGYKVRYSENADTWECWELQLSANTLSELKTKINKVDADARRLAGVPVLRLRTHWRPETIPAQAMLVDGEKDKVWVVFQEKVGGRVTPARTTSKREKWGMDEVVLDTPENRAAMAEAAKEYDRIRALEKALRERLERIPRVTREALTNYGKET